MLRERNGRVRGRCPCAGCGLTEELCACARLPRVDLDFDLVVVRHAYERNRGSNTARLLQTVVPRTRVLPFGDAALPFDAADLEALDRPLVLFPRGTRTLEPEDLRAATLIVLDGSWSQCRRMARRVPGLAKLPFVTLPSGHERVWKLRRSESENQVCTFEAVVRAVEVSGATEAAAALGEALRIVDALGQHSRGFFDRFELERRLAAIGHQRTTSTVALP